MRLIKIAAPLSWKKLKEDETMGETNDFEVKIEERYKYVGHQPDGPRSIGKYKT